MKNLIPFIKSCRQALKIGDIIIVATVIGLAVYMITNAKYDGGHKQLLLISGSEEIPLEWEDGTFSIYDLTGQKMIVQIEGIKARVVSSDCPDKLCVHSGWVSDCGHIAACLPNEVMIMIECREDFNVTDKTK